MNIEPTLKFLQQIRTHILSQHQFGEESVELRIKIIGKTRMRTRSGYTGTAHGSEPPETFVSLKASYGRSGTTGHIIERCQLPLKQSDIAPRK